MNWLVFSYSLSSQLKSSSRVSIWRRLKRLGALALNSGIYILPDKEECLESFQWLTQEVREAGGESLVMNVEKFEGLSDDGIKELFRKAVRQVYDDINTKLAKLEKELNVENKAKQSKQFKDQLRSLENQISEIAKIDFFQSPYGKDTMNRLKKIERSMESTQGNAQNLPSHSVKEYKNKKWVTRPRPHVDRLSSIWLIRKFINPKAKVRYADEPKPDEVPFDMKEVLFGHHQNLCTFETFINIFNLRGPGLKAMSEIIHDIDLKDGQYFHPQTGGIAAVLNGWRQAGLSNGELEKHGVTLFEGLYTLLQSECKGPLVSSSKK